jgi:CheY-like chemotaxis protein
MSWKYKTAVVIDDALGPPQPGRVPSEDKDRWIDYILDTQDACKRLLAAFNHLKITEIEKLLQELTSSSAHLQELWRRHISKDLTDVGLEILFDTEELNRQADAQKAAVVRDLLLEELGASNVRTYASLEEASEALCNADLAFVDFFLNKDEQAQTALDRIKANAEPLARPPLLFFMSSRANIETQQRVRALIHKRSAFFEVMRKQDITKEFVKAWLERKCESFEANQSLLTIINSLAQAISAAAHNLVEMTEVLETHDLALLNLARLKAEGETLGEYLTWLFSEFVAAKARRLSNEQKLAPIDSKQIGFTGQLRQSTVLFDLFSEVVFGPGLRHGEPVRFGEVLVSAADPNHYLLVVTPACDLARCEPNLEVLCVPGKASAFNDVRSHAMRRLYGKAGSTLCHLRVHPNAQGDKNIYSLIEWNTKAALTKPVSQLASDAFVRVQLMNEVFAQEVKEEALRSLGRVGTQINPPPAAPLRATIRWRLAKDQHEKSTPDDAFLAALMTYSEVTGPDKPHTGPMIVLSDDFRRWIRNEIEGAAGGQPLDARLVECLTDLNREHFKANNKLQFNGEHYRIQVLPSNETLPDKFNGFLEITLWTDAREEGNN